MNSTLSPEEKLKADRLAYGLPDVTQSQAAPVDSKSLKGDELAKYYQSLKTDQSSPQPSEPYNPVKSFGKNLAQDYSQYAKNFMNIPKEVMYINQPKNIGEVLPKAAQATFHGATKAIGNTIGAIFEPIGAAAKSVIPGKGPLSTIGQGISTGAALGGPGGAVAGGLMSLLPVTTNAIKSIPQVQQFLSKYPYLEEDLNNGMTTLLGYLGSKAAEKTAPEGKPDIFHTNVSEVPGRVGTNLVNTAMAPVNAATSLAKGAYNKVTGNKVPKSDKELDSIIQEKYAKAVKPTIKKNANQMDRANEDVVSGVKSIVKNKDNLKLMNEDGDVETGRTPETVDETLDAIRQTKQGIFKKYNDKQLEAGKEGVIVDNNNIADELQTVIDSKALKLQNPTVVSYAEGVQERLKAFGNLDPQEQQDAIQYYNNELKAFYRNPTPEGATKASIDALVVNKMRENLNSSIEKISGPGYQELKNEYGSLSSMENDVLKASQRIAKSSNKALIDYTDIFSGGEIIKGLASMNVAGLAKGAAMKGISLYYKYLNSPNKAISDMFGVADKGVQSANVIPTVTPEIPNKEGGFIKIGGEKPPTVFAGGKEWSLDKLHNTAADEITKLPLADQRILNNFDHIESMRLMINNAKAAGASPEVIKSLEDTFNLYPKNIYSTK